MNENNGFFPDDLDENRKEPAEVPAVETPSGEKDLLEKVIEQYLFTPRIRSKQHAREFLKDWMQRYSR